MAYPLPETLTPSKISRFVSCPLAFRYSYIERLPEPSTIHQVRGTLVHRALQLLYSGHTPDERDLDTAGTALETAWSEIVTSDEFASVGLSEDASATLRREASQLMERYFAIENPSSVHPVGLEIDLRATVDGVELRGIIDRLDHLDGDGFAIVDYKTGRAPRADQSRARLAGLHFYAFLCEEVLGRRPSEIRLIYVRDRVVVVESPTDQSTRAQRQRTLAIWRAIERACETGDFRPNPSRLCDWCTFKSHCPAFAGAPELASAAG